MEVSAYAKNIRISPLKMRAVADQIRKKKPAEAVAILGFIKKASAPIFKKVILSAIANAKNNFNLKEESLVFKKIVVENGPTLKRYRPVSRGRAHTILKRTGHIKVVLEGEKGTKAANLQQETDQAKLDKLAKEKSKTAMADKGKNRQNKGGENGTKG